MSTPSRQPPHPDVQEVLFSEAEIAARGEGLAAAINTDYAGLEIYFVGILKGAAPFAADLLRRIDRPLRLDFMAVSSYGSGARSSGAVRILKDLEEGIAGRHVLVVEDIVDSGLTLHYLRENLLARRPASLRICAFLDKPDRRKVDVPVDYVGFRIPDHFVVGYGLDYAERYRNLPYIGVLKPEVYQG